MALDRLLLATSLLACCVTGCSTPTVADGARMVFATSQVCTPDKVTVKERPDLAPHSVLPGVTPPNDANIDSVGSTYEISGCAKKLVMVCGRPYVDKPPPDPFSAGVTYPNGNDWADLSFNNEYYALTRAIDIDGDRVVSAVVCQPAKTSVQ
jgi:hypothetical protein